MTWSIRILSRKKKSLLPPMFLSLSHIRRKTWPCPPYSKLHNGLYNKRYLLSEFMHYELLKLRPARWARATITASWFPTPPKIFMKTWEYCMSILRLGRGSSATLYQFPLMLLSLLGMFEGTRIGTRRRDIKGKKKLQRLETQAPKKDGIGIAKGRYPGPGGSVIRRPMQRAIKNEDHGWEIYWFLFLAWRQALIWLDPFDSDFLLYKYAWRDFHYWELGLDCLDGDFLLI